MNDTIIPIDRARQYILSGKAIVIFLNTTTGINYKYKVRQDKDNDELWWVNSMSIDPKTQKPYLIGTIRREYSRNAQSRTDYTFRQSTTYNQSIQLMKDVFKAIWQRIVVGAWRNAEEESRYQIMHDGTCGKCGRPLTTLESINCGIGPECKKLLGI